MDFALPDELVELKERTERFVREQIMPYENDPRQTAHGPTEELRRELVGARARGRACSARMSGANGAGSGSTIAARRWCSRRPAIRRWRRSR